MGIETSSAKSAWGWWVCIQPLLSAGNRTPQIARPSSLSLAFLGSSFISIAWFVFLLFTLTLLFGLHIGHKSRALKADVINHYYLHSRLEVLWHQEHILSSLYPQSPETCLICGSLCCWKRTKLMWAYNVPLVSRIMLMLSHPHWKCSTKFTGLQKKRKARDAGRGSIFSRCSVPSSAGPLLCLFLLKSFENCCWLFLQN